MMVDGCPVIKGELKNVGRSTIDPAAKKIIKRLLEMRREDNINEELWQTIGGRHGKRKRLRHRRE